MDELSERREYSRFKCEVPVVIYGGKPLKLTSVLVTNFSDGGLYFEISNPLQAGDEIMVKTDAISIFFPADSDTWEQRKAETRWCVEIGAGDRRRYGCGIQYVIEK